MLRLLAKHAVCIFVFLFVLMRRNCFAGKAYVPVHVAVDRLWELYVHVVVFVVQVFQPYAKFWLPELARLVIAGDHGGEGLHYFVVDVLVTMLSWSSTAVLQVMWHVQENESEF